MMAFAETTLVPGEATDPEATGSPMVGIERVSQRYTTRDGSVIDALIDVSLDIKAGEFVSLVGASGCGKSTLLRLICGLNAPTKGAITVDGVPMDGPRDDLAMVFQAPTLLPWATILDNVLFPLKLRGKVTRDGQDHARSLLSLAGLSGFEKRLPKELSGGMQQRASICRGLVQKPNVLLMDEPFGALDALTREEMSLELLRIWSHSQNTVIFVTHSISEAVLLSDRVVVMSPRPGRVAEIIEVDLPRPRSFDLLGEPAAQEAMHRIRELIYADRSSNGGHSH